MCKKLFGILLAVFISSSLYAFTDSLWIVGGERCPGGLLPVEVWLQYEGSGVGDSMMGFNIMLTWDAGVCSVEASVVGQDFWDANWCSHSIIDNQGVHGLPAVPKISVSAIMCHTLFPIYIPRGSHLAATVDFRVLDTASPGDSTCLDTLMEAFSPTLYLGFEDKDGIDEYIPSFSTDCIRVIECSCGDCNGDGSITAADRTYILNYIYFEGSGMVCDCDVNLDGRITAADGTYILAYIYFGGPEPCNPPLGKTPFREKRMER